MKKLFALSVLLASAATLPAANLILNPGFELGTTDWTLTGTSTGTPGAEGVHGYNHTGALSGWVYCPTSCSPGSTMTISQTIATDIGHDYQVDFWMSADSCCAVFGANGGIAVEFGGVTGFSVAPGAGNPLTPFVTWIPYSFTVTANSTTSTFAFSAFEMGTGSVFLDDVSVIDLGQSQAAQTPEPATWLSLVTGLGVLSAVRRRLTTSR